MWISELRAVGLKGLLLPLEIVRANLQLLFSSIRSVHLLPSSIHDSRNQCRHIFRRVFRRFFAKRILFSKPSKSDIAHFPQIGFPVSVLFSLAKVLQCGHKKHKSLANCTKGFFNQKVRKFCHILRKKGQKSPYLETQFVEIAKTKQETIFLTKL
jgi:hypothetical protein